LIERALSKKEMALAAALHSASYADFLTAPGIVVLPIVLEVHVSFTFILQLPLKHKLSFRVLVKLAFLNPRDARMLLRMTRSEILIIITSYKKNNGHKS
jgi:hypothetical protein